MIEIIDAISQMQTLVATALAKGKTIGFVPTMGNLHQGHASLLKRARQENDLVILSVFINPTQFNNPDDFTHYPRTLKNDFAVAEQENVDYLFTPNKEALYPDDYKYKVTENNLSQVMEGKHRPGHFDGVLTIVMKLLQITRATHAYFGEKDFQQLELIRGMASAFFLTTKIIRCPTIRETNGLAFSSRNNRLNPEELQQANRFYQLLSSDKTCDDIATALTQEGFKVEYIEEQNGRRFGAVFLNQIRLIDNVEIEQIC